MGLAMLLIQPAVLGLLATGRPGAVVARPCVQPPIAPVLMQTGGLMGRVKSLNEMNKMAVVRKDEKPRARPQRLPPAMVEVTGKFKKVYTKAQLELLWGALLQCYGTPALAEAAVLENPQILNPSYSFCNTMIASRDVLVDMMGKEEALEVMLKNPAVLQCGPALDTLGPDEIKGFANLRSTFNRIPENVRGLALSALIAFVLFPILAANSGGALDDSALLQFAKVGNGLLFAILIEGSRIVIVGTIIKGKLSGDERLAKAEANERRRMGKGPK